MPLGEVPSSITQTGNGKQLYVLNDGSSVVDGSLTVNGPTVLNSLVTVNGAIVADSTVATAGILNTNQVYSASNPTVVLNVATAIAFSPALPANNTLPTGIYSVIGKFTVVSSNETNMVGINGLFYNNGTNWIGTANGLTGLPYTMTIANNTTTGGWGYFATNSVPGLTLTNLVVNLVFAGDVVGISNL